MGDSVVAHLVHALNTRAIADVVRTIADDMVRAGRDVVVLARHVTPGAPQPVLAPVLDLGGEGIRTLRTLPQLVAIVDALEVGTIFAHGEGCARAAVAAQLLGRTQPKIVTVTHNHYSSYHPASGRRLSTLRHAVDAQVLRAADVVTGVSPGVVTDLKSAFPAVASRVAMLPAPLTRAARLREQAAEHVSHPWFDGRPLLVCVGHLHPRKDQITLLRALAQTPTHPVDGPPHLLLIGAADGAYADQVRALARELGISDRVQLLGAVDNPLPYVARATALVLTSRNEGMSIAIVEALALGVPVVTTDAPSGPRWLVEDGRCGLVVPVGDAAAIAAALWRLLDDVELRDRLAARGRARARDFTPAVITQRYLQVLDALHADPGDRRVFAAALVQERS